MVKLHLKKCVSICFCLLLLLLLTACGNSATDNAGTALVIDPSQKELTIAVSGDGIEQTKTFTLEQLAKLENAGFEHLYSTINNWPTKKITAARGITLKSILKEAGVFDTAQVITVKSPDSYQMTFTRQQLLDEPRYFFPGVMEDNADNAEPVEAILAYQYADSANTLDSLKMGDFCLYLGQTNYLEHTNPAFVGNTAEIIVSNQQPEQWEKPTTFPLEGNIAIGEVVKLQHKSFGLVNIFYTLDGSDPTEMSALYNPSTYQPELNKPIVIDGNTVIKALVVGYGKENSEIATFTFTTDK